MNIVFCAGRIFGMFFVALVSISCSQPGESKRIDGPGNGVTYIIKTSYGAGAATSDYTEVFATPLGGKESESTLVLSGENLDIKKVVWTDASNVSICLSGGITDRYVNQVFVGVKGDSVKIRNHLFENC